MAVEYRVLGPLEAHVGGRRVELGTPKQRALLARLLLQPNTVVPAARLVDELWATPEGVKTPTSKLVVYQQPTSPATPARPLPCIQAIPSPTPQPSASTAGRCTPRSCVVPPAEAAPTASSAVAARATATIHFIS